MNKTIKLLGLLILFVILSTYSPKINNENKSYFFQIKNIEIIGNNITNTNKIIQELNYLNNSSLLFLQNEKIENSFKKFEFFLKYEIKKVYPSTIKITVFEKKPIAINIYGKKKFYLLKNNEKINFIELELYSNLPIIFGKTNNFSEITDALEQVDFNIKKIKSFYYYDIGRWDLTLKNSKIIKLPKYDYLEALANFKKIELNENFKKYNNFDYRIKNQLIIN